MLQFTTSEVFLPISLPLDRVPTQNLLEFLSASYPVLERLGSTA